MVGYTGITPSSLSLPSMRQKKKDFHRIIDQLKSKIYPTGIGWGVLHFVQDGKVTFLETTLSLLWLAGKQG